MAFEPLIVANPGLLDGAIGALVVLDPDAGTPNTILETDDNWVVQINWNTSGLVCGALGGTWHAKAFLESLEGNADPGLLGIQNVPLSNGIPNPPPPGPPTSIAYSATINVPAGKVTEGLYKLTATVVYDVTIGGFNYKMEMAAFTEGPLVQFYDAK